ncbi:MAG: chromate transporter [Erysipelothrix sp.]|nr:chromate transporter [Erysipelothrix sp.]
MIKTFIKLGFTAFGGPAAHIAMLQEEAVVKNQWLSQEDFAALNSLTNLIPGPNSSEMVLGVGYYIDGIPGLIKAGLSFMLPSISIVMIISMFFVSWISEAWVQVLLDGMTPVLLIMIGQVFYRFFRSGIKTSSQKVLFIIGCLLLALGLSELSLLLVFALGFIFHFFYKKQVLVVEPISTLMIFTLFLKIGATLYGSGYVLLSYLETSFLKYMSQQDIVNAFLIGEITPGPVFTSATAVGVFLGGPIGGLVATLGIFLPSFLIMMLLMPIKERMTKIAWIQYALKGINIASIVLIAKVLFSLSLTTMISIQALVLLGIALVLRFGFKISPYLLLVLLPIINYIFYLLV